MAATVEKALVSFLAGLCCRKRHLLCLAIVGWALLAQTLLVVHRIEHNRTEHGTTCALCVAADHSANTNHQAAIAITPSLPAALVAMAAQPAAAFRVLSYRSRAPPTEHRRT